jgi:hypothetical protein
VKIRGPHIAKVELLPPGEQYAYAQLMWREACSKVRNKVGIMRGIERNARRRHWAGVKVRTQRGQ